MLARVADELSQRRWKLSGEPALMLARVADELSQRRWKLSGETAESLCFCGLTGLSNHAEPAESLRFCMLNPVSIDELQLSHLAG
jgi:hypothetical protein